LFCLASHHLNQVEFTIELWKKDAFITSPLNNKLKQWFFLLKVLF
jgi:hypothetical protein